jgi:4-amino-4-deoxychorismate lyase
VSVWINGRHSRRLDYRDRGLQYGDGLFETMRVHRRKIRLLQYHLDRLEEGCQRLDIMLPPALDLRSELEHAAASRAHAVLKLIVTRGPGSRGYRPSGRESSTRIISIEPLPPELRAALPAAVRLRLCATALSVNPSLAGLKTLNRLDSVLARAEWSDVRIWDGLMRDVDGNWVCGTMSNLFLRVGSLLITPRLDRCGVAGVMRRWILTNAAALRVRIVERRIGAADLESAEEMFMTNALVGIKTVRTLTLSRAKTLRFTESAVADRFRVLLDMA